MHKVHTTIWCRVAMSIMRVQVKSLALPRIPTVLDSTTVGTCSWPLPHKPLADGKSDQPAIVGTEATETRIMTVPLPEMDRKYDSFFPYQSFMHSSIHSFMTAWLGTRMPCNCFCMLIVPGLCCRHLKGLRQEPAAVPCAVRFNGGPV